MFHRFGRGIRRTPGVMNKTEAAYAETLRLRQIAGEVLWYSFESVKLKLAPNTHYTPDFIVMLSDGTIEIHEVKGFREDDYRVKIKVAANTFPFRFFEVTVRAKKNGGGWNYEEIGTN